MIKIEKILNGKLFENCYFIHAENVKTGFCIDPGYDYESIDKFLKKNDFKVSDILLTHGHFDHMLSCQNLIDDYNSNVYVSKEDEAMLFEPEHNYATMLNKTSLEKYDIYKNVHDNEDIIINGIKIHCISTPGHTKGGFSYYLESEKILFSGDTLFFETFGRTDLYGGSFTDIENSIIHKLFLLPDDTTIYPGHGEKSTIAYEKIHNEIRRDKNEL